MTASPVPAAALVQAFFVEHLLNQKHASPRTLATYRDAFRLLLRFIHQTHGIEPAALNVENLDTPVILAFLDHIEQQRSNSIRSRNARLAATFLLPIRSNARASRRGSRLTRARHSGKAHGAQADWLSYTSRDRCPPIGRRSGHALLLTLYNSGARVSEIIGVRRDEIVLDAPASLKLHGKGRKERAVPLWTKTAQILRAWFLELGDRFGGLAFPSARARRLSRHGVSFLLSRLADRATAACPSLRNKTISPHVIRHSTAMHLLQSGVDPAVIALWLGHESVETTHGYVEADLTMMEKAMGKLAPAGSALVRFKASDDLLAFLATL
jgi:integrase/recombinase XerD